MESLIPIISNLQPVSKAIGDDDFELPRIVVLGSQGSGKSSVLENFVGRSFLPKGTGIVTRTPLVLKLVHSPREPGPHRRRNDETLDVEEYGVFDHTEKIFTDFDDICSEIQRQTVKIAGNNKGICDQEITLILYSPRLPNLTLVDLPGLTKLPIGDQAVDVETQIRNLVLMYVQNTDAIIMAVVPANTDMATNESLKLAKDCNPEGDRTLVVLTKVDLMDAGTDATDILMGNVISVKLGIVAVVNRSQRDVDYEKPISQVLKDEAKVLRSKCPSLADVNGTPFLVETMTKLLLTHIRDYLVDVESRVELKIMQVEALIDFYSEEDEEKDKGLLKIVKEFSSAYCEDVTSSASNLKTKTRAGGPLIFHLLHETFKTELNEIKLAETTKGLFNTKLDPEEILKVSIEGLNEPSIRCAKNVCEEMKQLLWKCAYEGNLSVEKLPALRKKILADVERLLSTQHTLTENVIRDETFYDLTRIIFCMHNFEKKSQVVDVEEFRKQIAGMNWDDVVQELTSYFETARRTVYDDVTVTVMQLLVNDVRNKVRDELVEKFSSPGTGRIFHGAQNFSEERKRQRKELEALYEARDIVGQLKENC